MNCFKKPAGFIIAILIYCTNPAWAQHTININSEATYRNALQHDGSAAAQQLTGEAEQHRLFDFNTALKSLSKENEGDSLWLDFFPGKQYRAVIKSIVVHNDQRRSITAQIAGSDYSYCFITVSERGIALLAELPQLDEQFSVAALNGTTYLLQHKLSVVQKDRIADSPPLIPPGYESLPVRPAATGNDDIEEPVTIDLLFVYTAAAAEYVTSRGLNIDDAIDMAMQRSNLVSNNSQTGVTFNLVYKYQTNYTETNTTEDLRRITNNNDGYMDEVHGLRDLYGADVVVFLPRVNYTGGQAWQLAGNHLPDGFQDWAFALCTVLYNQAWTTYTVVHEVGHNMGCGHHWQQSTQAGPGVFSYSSGYRGTTDRGNRYCTVMTYEEGQYFADGRTHSRIPYFSSPDLTFEGSVIGDATYANNALTLKQTKHLTAKYRATVSATLSELTVSEGMLTPAFHMQDTTYTVTVGNDVTTITFQATPYSPSATITGTGEHPLNVGKNSFPITVTDQTLSKVYTVTVVRNPDITALSVSAGTLTPAFDPNNTYYNLQLPCGAETLSVNTPQATGSTIAYTLNGATVTMPLTVDRADISNLQVIATAADETAKSYTIAVVRPFDASIIRQYWDDVLAVNLNTNTNGGYTFTAYRWLKNGQAIPNSNSPYLYFTEKPLPTDKYGAVLTANNKPIPVCEVTATTTAGATQSGLAAYPNPAKTAVTIENEAYKNTDRIELFDFNGHLLRSYPSAGKQTTIGLQGLLPGFYIVRTGGQTITIVIE